MKKALILLIMLIALSPAGILLVWNYGSAYAEWDHIGSWYPQHVWNLSPLPDYDISGWDSPLMASIGYIISAIAGILLIIALNYGIMRLLKHE